MHTTGKGVEILLGVLFFALGYLALRYIAKLKWNKDMKNRVEASELFSVTKLGQLGLGCVILQQRGALKLIIIMPFQQFQTSIFLRAFLLGESLQAVFLL